MAMGTKSKRATDHHRRRCTALPLFAMLAACVLAGAAHAETCTTQSGLAEPERNGIADAARTLAAKVLSNDATYLKANTIAEVAKDFGGVQYSVAVTSAKLTGGAPTVEQLYLLDASTLKPNPDGSAPDAQFFCSLNRSTAEADFLIPSLPPGKYAFAMVDITGAHAPWRLSFLMREDAGKWLLAGFYPKPLTAAGHDGLWYWTEARAFVKAKQPWNAWLYLQAAQSLLRPADFIVSTHLDKLRSEIAAAAPPVLSDGVSMDAPLVVKAADGTEYHFTALTVDDSLAQSALEIVAHLHADPLADPAAARKRNLAATAALLAAYPELRKPFHGISVYTDSTGQPTFSTEESMAEIK